MSKLLKKIEKRIQQNKEAAWYENNLLLLKIRDEGLYKKKYGTYQKYLEDRWGFGRERGFRLIRAAEFMQIAVKNQSQNVAEKDKFGNISEVILPTNEWQIRPLIEKLKHNGERLFVWAEVVGTGEKINAELVQTKVDEFLESGEIVPDIEYTEEEIIFGKKTHVSHNSGINEWYTPEQFIEAAKKVMGNIDCDPASSVVANKIVKAEKFFTEEENGLIQEWGYNVWLNPPYAQPLIGAFVDTLVEKIKSGEVNQACVLVNNATETKWFQSLLIVSSVVCFVASRIRFLDPEGKPGAPLQGQAILYIGELSKEFSIEFKTFGTVLFNGI